MPLVFEQLGTKPRDAHDQPLLTKSSCKRHEMLGLISTDAQGEILAIAKQFWLFPSQSEGGCDGMQFDAAVLHVLSHRAQLPLRALIPGGVFLDFLQAGKSLFVIYRPTIVRIYQAEVPYLSPLINVRHSWSGQLDQSLGKAVQHSEISGVSLKGNETFE